MTLEVKQHVVLCEGFDDRSFWKGWLRHLGCTDPTNGGKRTENDVWGRPVHGKGRFLFHTPAGSDVIVQPFHGRANARRAMEDLLGGHQTYRPSLVVLNLDSDAENDASGSAEDQIRSIARELGAKGGGRGPFQIEGSRLYAVLWECEDPDPTPGVPAKQTLERVVTSAIRAAKTDRGAAVEQWLNAEPAGLRLPKSFGYSYFAKWYSNHGDAHFYECVWQDTAVVRELEKRLRSTGAWQTVEELVRH